MHKMIERFAFFLLRHDLLTESDKAWCIYALERRILTFLSFSVLFIVGTLWSNPVASFCFIAPVLWLRKRTSGYHASTPLRCLLLSILVTYLALSLIFPYMKLCFLLVLQTVSFAIIWTLAPYNHKNLHFNQAELAANRICARKRLLFLTILCGALLLLKQLTAAYSLSLGMTMVACSLVAAKIAKQEELSV